MISGASPVTSNDWNPRLKEFYDSGAWSSWVKHFEPEEIYSPETILKRPDKLKFLSLIKLDEFRDEVGVPFLVNNWANGGKISLAGVRSFNENKSIRGAVESKHLEGCAFDVKTSLPNTTLFELAYKSNKWGGIGLYDWGCHLDDRFDLSDQPVIWDSRSPENQTDL